MEDNKQTIKTWRDVIITPEMPLMLIVDFLNRLNQRLANIEDHLMITQPDGSQITLTEMYNTQLENPEEIGE